MPKYQFLSEANFNKLTTERQLFVQTRLPVLIVFNLQTLHTQI